MTQPAFQHDPQDLQIDGQVLLQLQRLQLEKKFQRDPWAFLCYVKTIDQVEGGWGGDGQAATGRIRSLIEDPDADFSNPNSPDAYLKHVVQQWLTYPELAIPKSRRMRMTWLMVALHYWLARVRPGSKIAFVSRKEGRSESEGSAELVWRAKFIHEHLPDIISKPRIEYKFCRLTFPDTDSEIIGIGQGPDQLRQATLTAIFGDECAFWEQAAAFFAAAKPTTEGGGRNTLVSTANPGFFENLCNDRL